eukprot:TRINITY_DN66583_c1_g1_i1.p1 TRINITY_DN66583_c1_g1~~TRINITY_DN66583_c1_g1_i1.p1  ORF type:complete len:381 (+),score=164.34 TRINITY_DN66583_c1_g1_i1:54-1196(+)
MSEEAKQERRESKGVVLVTGGAGFIGTHTVVQLYAAGYRVEIVDNFVNSCAEAVERVRGIVGDEELVCHEVDLCDYERLEELFKSRPRFDAVIHFAGLKAVGESVQQPLRYYQNNLTGTLNLLELMEKYGCTNIVFSSSATVYGAAESPIKETAYPLDCTNAYGRTKLFIEEILRDVARGATKEKWRIVILRYFNPVGAHESGRIGEDPQGPPNNLMPYVSQVAVGRRPHLTVFGNDFPTKDGTGVRDYIHVVDLAEGHVAALDNGIFRDTQDSSKTRGPFCEAYNIGTGTGYSVLEMVAAMSKACGHEIKYVIGARRAGDVESGVVLADPSKAERELKWKAQFGLDRMCEDIWRWQSANPMGFNPSDGTKDTKSGEKSS